MKNPWLKKTAFFSLWSNGACRLGAAPSDGARHKK